MSKYKYVLLQGPDLKLNEAVKEAYNRPDRIIIQNFTFDDIYGLRGLVDSSTRFDINAHGDSPNICNKTGEYILEIGFSESKYAYVDIQEVLLDIKDVVGAKPVEVHLWSCHGGAANASALAPGSVLIMHSTVYGTNCAGNTYDGILKSIDVRRAQFQESETINYSAVLATIPYGSSCGISFEIRSDDASYSSEWKHRADIHNGRIMWKKHEVLCHFEKIRKSFAKKMKDTGIADLFLRDYYSQDIGYVDTFINNSNAHYTDHPADWILPQIIDSSKTVALYLYRDCLYYPMKLLTKLCTAGYNFHDPSNAEVLDSLKRIMITYNQESAERAISVLKVLMTNHCMNTAGHLVSAMSHTDLFRMESFSSTDKFEELIWLLKELPRDTLAWTTKDCYIYNTDSALSFIKSLGLFIRIGLKDIAENLVSRISLNDLFRIASLDSTDKFDEVIKLFKEFSPKLYSDMLEGYQYKDLSGYYVERYFTILNFFHEIGEEQVAGQFLERILDQAYLFQDLSSKLNAEYIVGTLSKFPGSILERMREKGIISSSDEAVLGHHSESLADHAEHLDSSDPAHKAIGSFVLGESIEA